MVLAVNNRFYNERPLAANQIADVGRIIAGKVPSVTPIAQHNYKGILFIDVEVAENAGKHKKVKCSWRVLVLGQDSEAPGVIVAKRLAGPDQKGRSVITHGSDLQTTGGGVSKVHWCTPFQHKWAHGANGTANEKQKDMEEQRNRYTSLLLQAVTGDHTLADQDWDKVQDLMDENAKYLDDKPATTKSKPAPATAPKAKNSQKQKTGSKLNTKPAADSGKASGSNDRKSGSPSDPDGETDILEDFQVNKFGRLDTDQQNEAEKLMNTIRSVPFRGQTASTVTKFAALMNTSYPSGPLFEASILKGDDDVLVRPPDGALFQRWWAAVLQNEPRSTTPPPKNTLKHPFSGNETGPVPGVENLFNLAHESILPRALLAITIKAVTGKNMVLIPRSATPEPGPGEVLENDNSGDVEMGTEWDMDLDMDSFSNFA